MFSLSAILGHYIMKKVIFLIFSLLPLLAWGYAVIEHFSNKEWIMLALSAFIPPVGVINGAGMYFGFW